MDKKTRLSKLTKSELIAIARSLKVTGYSGKNKSALIDHITGNADEQQITTVLNGSPVDLVPVEKEKACAYKGCGRERHDDKHCIFHSKDIEGKKEQFNNEFLKEFYRQKEEEELDFRGFVFPDDISFEKIEFIKANFGSATFSGDASFLGATFSGDAHFRDATFSRYSNFMYATFSGKASFLGATFSGDAIFNSATFSGEAAFGSATFSDLADFGDATFSVEASFWSATFSEKADFAKATFSGKAYFKDASFSGEADFEAAKFLKESNFKDINITEKTKISMRKTRLEDVTGLFESIDNHRKILKRTKRQEFLPDDIKPILGTVTESTYPIYSRKVKDDMYLLRYQEKHPKSHFLWWLFADCGRSLGRWALWSLIFALYFAGNFWLIDYAFPTAFSFDTAIQDRSLWSFIYYSVVTFTTLGFGDIIPTLAWVQRWVMAEVIMGYIMLGGLISILANKLARRS